MTPFFIILFLVFALLILFAAHYMLYFTSIVFFSMTSTTSRTLAVIGLAFMGTSFFLASFLDRLGDNFFTRAFYFISGFWLGLVLNLLLAISVAWIIVWLSRMGNSSVNTAILGTIFFGLSLVFSFYGVWNSMNPKIKNIEVSIPNLPQEWKEKKIVQLSDLHLGHIYRAKFMRYIVNKINTVNPEMVLITGDLFDGMDGDLNAPLKPLNNLKPEKGIYFVTGNHETYLGLNKVYNALENTDIKVLRDEVVDADGLKIIGVNYPNRGEKKDIVKIVQGLEKDFQGKPNIFMYHSPVNIDKFSQMGIGLQLAGHTHSGQLFPLNYITSLIYKGYDYGLHKIDDYTLYTTCGAGAWGPTMRTGNRPEIVVITLQ